MAAGERSVNFSIVAKDAASRVLKNINKNLTGTRGIAATVGADLKKAALGVAGLASGIAYFTARAIQGAAADQASTAKLMATLKARKFATEGVTAAIDAQIAAGAKLGFTDDEIRGSVEASTRFTKKYSVAQKIQTTAMNLARATGMDLAEATLAVGKAYAGTGGKALKNLGITKQGIKGQEALNAILSKTRGTAAAYADTAEGAFTTLSIQAAELKESFGAAFLPAVTKLFKGLQPFLDRFSNYIKAATPDIQKFTDKLVSKFLAKLPGWIAAAEEKLPSLFRQFGDFVDSIKGIGKEADRVLGPGGAIRVAITGISAAFGGLRGAIATNLLASGVDPIKAYFISTASAGILTGVINGMTQALTTAAVTKFFNLFKNVPMTFAPTAPVGTAPGSPVGTGITFAGIGAALKTFATTIGTGLAAVGGAAAATGGAGLFPLFDPNVPGSLTGPDGPLGFLNQSGNDQKKNWDMLWEKYRAMGISDSNAYKAITYEQGLKYNIEAYTTEAYKAAYDKIAAGYGLAFSTPYGSTNSPMEAKYTSNIYIGTAKVDTVVSDSLERILPGGGRGQ